jgi:hypothetical protein
MSQDAITITRIKNGNVFYKNGFEMMEWKERKECEGAMLENTG